MFTNNYSNVADLVKQDILDWISKLGRSSKRIP